MKCKNCYSILSVVFCIFFVWFLLIISYNQGKKDNMGELWMVQDLKYMTHERDYYQKNYEALSEKYCKIVPDDCWFYYEFNWSEIRELNHSSNLIMEVEFTVYDNESQKEILK